jgi:hypothetical protein
MAWAVFDWLVIRKFKKNPLNAVAGGTLGGCGRTASPKELHGATLQLVEEARFIANASLHHGALKEGEQHRRLRLRVRCDDFACAWASESPIRNTSRTVQDLADLFADLSVLRTDLASEAK